MISFYIKQLLKFGQYYSTRSVVQHVICQSGKGISILDFETLNYISFYNV